MQTFAQCLIHSLVSAEPISRARPRCTKLHIQTARPNTLNLKCKEIQNALTGVLTRLWGAVSELQLKSSCTCLCSGSRYSIPGSHLKPFCVVGWLLKVGKVQVCIWVSAPPTLPRFGSAQTHRFGLSHVGAVDWSSNMHLKSGYKEFV